MANHIAKANHILDTDGNTVDKSIDKLQEDVQWLKDNGVSEEVLTQKVTEVVNSPSSPAASKVELNRVKSQLDDIEQKKANDVDVRKKNILIDTNDITDTLRQQINGNAPIIQTVGDGIITPTKTTFIKVGDNLYDYNALGDGYISNTNGVVMSHATYKCTDYILINSFNSYYLTTYFSKSHFSFYDNEKKYINSVGFNLSSPFTPPTNAKYIRMTLTDIGNARKAWISTKNLTSYVDYEEKLAYKYMPKLNFEDLYNVNITDTMMPSILIPSKNLFNKNEIYNGYINYTNGSLLAHSTYKASGFIELNEVTNYSFNSSINSQHFCFYDTNKNAINGTVNTLNSPFTPPANAKYIRVTFLSADKIENAQLEKGSVSTDYEPFGLNISEQYMSNYIKKNEITIPKTEIVLPSNIFILKGDANNKEQYNIYFKNIQLGYEREIDIVSSYGKQLEECYRVESSYNLPNAPFNVTVNCIDDDLKVVATKNTTIEMVDESNTNKVNYLAIGDSITREGRYVEHLCNKLPNIETKGIRTYGNETFSREGRGGWRLYDYTNSMRSIFSTSPFVFPENVDGNKYFGSTSFWRNVCYDKPNDYDYAGFQKIARGWRDSGDYLYNTNGYLKNPSIGDVMVDSNLPQGSNFVKWNGSVWETISPQPNNVSFNFSKYISRYPEIYSSGTPTHISILLGANDFQTTNGLENITMWLSNLNTVLTSIKEYDSNIKIFLCMPTIGANQDAWGARLDSGAISKNYDTNMKKLSSKLIEIYDNASSKANGIYVVPMLINIDSITGFDFVEENVNIYSTSKIKRYNNWVHPNITVGHKQMGDTLAAFIQKYR